MEAHLRHLKALFTCLQEAGLTINLAKSTLCKAKLRYLGQVIGYDEIVLKQEDVASILIFPVPGLLRFLGKVLYYRIFCRNYSIVASSLTDLTSPKNKFVRTESCQHAFDQLKNILCANLALATPDLSKSFIIQVDACSTGVGAILMQENAKTKLLHPVFFSTPIN